MDPNVFLFTPIKAGLHFHADSFVPLRPKPLEIPLNSYYNKWRLSDKIFDGRFSGTSTPVSPRTPAQDRIVRAMMDNSNYLTPVLPQVSRFNLKDSESPCSGNSIEPDQKIQKKSRYENDFIQIDLIGSGEFGNVYKCVHRIDGLQYAVKKIPTHPSKKTSIKMALQEAYVLATSSILEDNAYIVRYHSVWLENQRLYISMELCQCSLAKHIKDIEITEGLIRKILRDVCKALKKIHSHDIVHMDIKAENILFSFSKKFKLGDLGLGRVLTNLTDLREGDARYLAKEVLVQATDDPAGVPDLCKADIFSLGATCYEIMRGKPLPKNGPEWHKIRNGEIEECKGFSNEINQCIQKMMSSDVGLRPSAKELLETVLLSEKQLQVKKWRNYAENLEEEICELKQRLGFKKRKYSM